MAGSKRHLRTGSDAGRGFRYQDAVATLIAVQLWQENSAGLVFPEGGDDIEKRVGSTRNLISVKSRRHERGPFRPSDINSHVAQLARRASNTIDAGLELILERDLTEDARRAAGREITIKILTSPRDDAVLIVQESIGCLPIAAEIAVAKLQDLMGDLADQNGPLEVTERLGLGAAEIDKILSEAASSIDEGAMNVALGSGIVEAVDFNTKKEEASFYSGVDVEPGHLAAGLVVYRPKDGEAVENALETRGRAVVCGPSGAGKSAIMWQVARATRHSIRWYRLSRLENEDVAALNRFLNGLRISSKSPVGFVLDDAGRRLPGGWSKMLDLAHRIPGLTLLASCREEDLVSLRTSDTPLLRPDATDDLAKALWEKLRENDETRTAGWREAWASSNGLLMEYTHTLSTDTRLREVLREQVIERLADPNRDQETNALRIVSCAHASGARIDVRRLAKVLDINPAAVSRAFLRLAREHLVRAEEDGLVAPLHQLRSKVLLEEAHVNGATSFGDTVAAAIISTYVNDLATLLGDIDVNNRDLIDCTVTAVALRVSDTNDPVTLAQGLRGLTILEAKHVAAHWLTHESVERLMAGQRPIAAMMGLANADLSEKLFSKDFTGAARAFSEQLGALENSLRAELLNKCKPETIFSVFAGASPEALLDVLSAMVGMADLPVNIHTALLDHGPDLTKLPFDDVISLLETVAELDRDLADQWVTRDAPDGLLYRIENEIPWATPPSIGERDGITVAACNHVHIADEFVADTHGEVVSLCRYLFALAPKTDRADVQAVDANGIRLAVGDFEIAVKRMPRSASPPKSRTDWNRLLGNAISTGSKLETRTAFLAEASRISTALSPVLNRVLDRVIRGKQPSERDLKLLGDCHLDARTLTSPVAAFSESKPDDVDLYSQIQDALFFASADLVRRYAGLPDGANALSAYCGEQAKKLWEAIDDPMWSLLDSVSLKPFEDIAATLEAIRTVAWDQGQRSARSVNPRLPVTKAGNGNALRTASRLAQRDLDRLSGKLLEDIDTALAEKGLEAIVFLQPVELSQVPAAASGVLVLVEVTVLEDIFIAAPLVFQLLRTTVPQFTELMVIPIFDGGHLTRFGLGGFENPTPLLGDRAVKAAQAILTENSIPAVPLPVNDLANNALSTALAIGNFVRSGRGGADHPRIENERLESLTQRLAGQREKLTHALGQFAELIDPALSEAQETGVGTTDLQQIVSGDYDAVDANPARTALIFATMSVDMGLELADD